MQPPPHVRAQYLAASVEVAEGAVLVPIAESSLLRHGTVHVITAWNPGAARPTIAENEAANRELHRVLVERGFSPVHAVGREPDGTHCEDSWAVAGMPDDEARAIGARFGQDAIFRFAEGVQMVVACDGSWSDSRPI